MHFLVRKEDSFTKGTRQDYTIPRINTWQLPVGDFIKISCTGVFDVSLQFPGVRVIARDATRKMVGCRGNNFMSILA